MTKSISGRLKRAEVKIQPVVPIRSASAEEMAEWIRELLAAPPAEGPPSLITADGRPLTATEWWLNSLIKEGCAG